MHTPSQVRPALAQAAALAPDAIQQALLDAALGATRDHWATFSCPDCGKKHRAQVAVPDVRSRVAAIELLLREGLGRPAQAEEPVVSRIPESVEAVKAMSWDDLRVLMAMTFATEVSAVSERGPEALRERVVRDEWLRTAGNHRCFGVRTSSLPPVKRRGERHEATYGASGGDCVGARRLDCGDQRKPFAVPASER